MALPAPVPTEDLTTKINGVDYNLLVESFNELLAHLEESETATATALAGLATTAPYVSFYDGSAFPVPDGWEDRWLVFIAPVGVYPPSQYAVNGNYLAMAPAA